MLSTLAHATPCAMVVPTPTRWQADPTRWQGPAFPAAEPKPAAPTLRVDSLKTEVDARAEVTMDAAVSTVLEETPTRWQADPSRWTGPAFPAVQSYSSTPAPKIDAETRQVLAGAARAVARKSLALIRLMPRPWSAQMPPPRSSATQTSPTPPRSPAAPGPATSRASPSSRLR